MKRNYMYKTLIIMVLFPVVVFSENIYVAPNGKKINIINSESIRSENNKEEEFIYLDKIIETEEERKEEKRSKIERVINKIDEKVNPSLIFNIFTSYGNWYLIKTTSTQELRYENISYNFKQEQSGYRIEKNYYNKSSREWITANERGWIEEKKGKVYLGTEKKWFTSYSNEILFFDKNYKYMIVKYESDGIIRVFARTLGKIDLDSEDREKFDKIINLYSNLKDVQFDSNIDNEKEKKEKERIEIERKAKIIEEQIIKDSKSIFKID